MINKKIVAISVVVIIILLPSIFSRGKDFIETKKEKDKNAYMIIQGDGDLKNTFGVNSASMGYYYNGTDENFHYFSSKWGFRMDDYFKIKKEDLNIHIPYRFGHKELIISAKWTAPEKREDFEISINNSERAWMKLGENKYYELYLY